MSVLMQVGPSSWVDPETIQAIEWGPYSACPTIIIGTVRVSARKFKCYHDALLDTPEKCTDALIALIKVALRKPTPPTFQGKHL
jgi:hypothetical protein